MVADIDLKCLICSLKSHEIYSKCNLLCSSNLFLLNVDSFVNMYIIALCADLPLLFYAKGKLSLLAIYLWQQRTQLRLVFAHTVSYIFMLTNAAFESVMLNAQSYRISIYISLHFHLCLCVCMRVDLFVCNLSSLQLR